jgi:hypothetical protein
MKKFFDKALEIIFIILLCLLTIAVIGSVWYATKCAGDVLDESSVKSSQYAKTAKITEIDYKADVAVCVDGTGNEWAFTEVEDFEVGDFVSMLMSDNKTPLDITDDVIEQVRFAGTFEEG